MTLLLAGERRRVWKQRLKRVPLLAAAGRQIRALSGHAMFLKEFRAFERACSGTESRFPLRWKDRWPCMTDRTGAVGYEPHYLYHPAWAARILAETRPPVHVDISSTLAFCTIISAFVPVEYYEYRRPDLRLSNLCTGSADLLALPFPDGSIQSLSCMHTVEHVGLGRYGDPIHPDGDLKAISELKRVLAPGGNLLFVVPTGKPRIRYNANRIYSYEMIRSYFSDLSLRQFALIVSTLGGGELVYDAQPELADTEAESCGCFWFSKPLE